MTVAVELEPVQYARSCLEVLQRRAAAQQIGRLDKPLRVRMCVIDDTVFAVAPWSSPQVLVTGWVFNDVGGWAFTDSALMVDLDDPRTAASTLFRTRRILLRQTPSLVALGPRRDLGAFVTRAMGVMSDLRRPAG